MKKIILGLFLTVGVSGIALAENQSNNQEIKINDLKQKCEIVKIMDKAEKLFDCWYGHRYDTYDSQGNLIESLSFGSAGPCRDGDADGTVSVRFHKQVQEISTDVN